VKLADISGTKEGISES